MPPSKNKWWHASLHGPENSPFLSVLSLNSNISIAILCWDVYFWSKIRVKARMSKIPFSLSPKSTWRVWNQRRGTHSVWQCLPFIYLLCAMQALAPSSISLAHELLLLSLSLSPMHTISPSLSLSLSLTLLPESALHSSHVDRTLSDPGRQLFILRRNTFRRIALHLKKDKPLQLFKHAVPKLTFTLLMNSHLPPRPPHVHFWIWDEKHYYYICISLLFREITRIVLTCYVQTRPISVSAVWD